MGVFTTDDSPGTLMPTVPEQAPLGPTALHRWAEGSKVLEELPLHGTQICCSPPMPKLVQETKGPDGACTPVCTHRMPEQNVQGHILWLLKRGEDRACCSLSPVTLPRSRAVPNRGPARKGETPKGESLLHSLFHIVDLH